MDTNNGHIEFEGRASDDEIIPNDNKPMFNLSREKMAEIFDRK
jgi:hypothetical protein